MTNKQIIIDRVDVSEWTDEEIYYKFKKHSSKAIRQIAFDLYKQLKRKEQECEELEKQVEVFTRQLEKDNKEVIKEKKENATQRQENNKLKQTLAEIKEIAKNMNKECFYDDFDCEDCDMKNGCTYQGKIKILQKISEVEK